MNLWTALISWWQGLGVSSTPAQSFGPANPGAALAAAPAPVVDPKIQSVDLTPILVQAKPRQIVRIPRIIVAESALNAMVDEVLAHPTIETAWGLYGLVSDDQEEVIVCGIIGDNDVIRRTATTQLGGRSQDQAFAWLEANFRVMKRSDEALSRWHFSYLFKGHSHYTLGLGRFSGQDVSSMRDVVETEGLPIAIGPLATLSSRLECRFTLLSPRKIVVERYDSVTMRFYFLSQAMLEAGKREPITIEPEIIADGDLPKVSKLSWQFTSPEYYRQQLYLLKRYGCTVTVLYQEDKGVPLTIKFLVTNPDWSSSLAITTAWDFPESEPMFMVIPEEGAPKTIKPTFNRETTRYEKPWDREMNLVDSVRSLIERGDLS